MVKRFAVVEWPTRPLEFATAGDARSQKEEGHDVRPRYDI